MRSCIHALAFAALLSFACADPKSRSSPPGRPDGPIRLLDAPERLQIESRWDPRRNAIQPERGLTPLLAVEFESGLPGDAVVVPSSRTMPGSPRLAPGVSLQDFPPRVDPAAAASGTAGLRFQPAVGAVCFVAAATPRSAYQVDVSARSSLDSHPDLQRVGQLIVLELAKVPATPADVDAVVHADDARSRILAIHSQPVSHGSHGLCRITFQASERTHALLVVLMGGIPGWWIQSGATTALDPPEGSVDFDSLRVWRLPLSRFLAIESDSHLRSVEVNEDLRRSILAPSGTRVTIPLAWSEGRRRLRFAYALLDAGATTEGESDLSFRARLERAGAPPRILLQDHVAAGSASTPAGWREVVLELDGEESPASLVLETGSDAQGELMGAFAEPKLERVELPKAQPTSTILISIDTLRADRLGCYGYRRTDGRETSPRLDAFARQCVRFASARAPSSYTLPSTATLFTGLSPAVHRVSRLGRALSPDRHPLIASEFAKAGCATAAFTAGGYVSAEHGFAEGFDRYGSRDPFVSDDGCAEIVRWIEAQQGRPYFLFVHTYLVHDYAPPPELERAFCRTDPDRFTRRGQEVRRRAPEFVDADEALGSEEVHVWQDLYDATIAAADAKLGELLEFLARDGALDRTIVAIVSDHGEEHGEHGSIGHGTSLFEELLRVPVLLHVPGVPPAVIGDPVDLADVAPTLRDAAGLPARSPCDGVSLLERMRDGDYRESFWAELEVPGKEQERALRIGSMKLIERGPFPRKASNPSRSKAPSHWELFDLSNYPVEQVDLVPRFEPQARESTDRLPEPYRTIRRRFEAERAAWRARGAEIVPDPSVLERDVSQDMQRRLKELGYAVGE